MADIRSGKPMRKPFGKTVLPLIYVDSVQYFPGGRMRSPFRFVRRFSSAEDPVVKELAQ
jgi:hypothetical protein